ncbi:MAG: hypothetical protein KBH11_09145, partial [Bacteroidia bacterium]|nr:hypothetical protein [Bacteroidia bacterium]
DELSGFQNCFILINLYHPVVSPGLSCSLFLPCIYPLSPANKVSKELLTMLVLQFDEKTISGICNTKK